MSRTSIIHDVMPDWNGPESIVAYSIRMRRERRERRQREAMRRAMLTLCLAVCTPLILTGVVSMVAAIMTQTLP